MVKKIFGLVCLVLYSAPGFSMDSDSDSWLASTSTSPLTIAQKVAQEKWKKFNDADTSPLGFEREETLAHDNRGVFEDSLLSRERVEAYLNDDQALSFKKFSLEEIKDPNEESLPTLSDEDAQGFIRNVTVGLIGSLFKTGWRFSWWGLKKAFRAVFIDFRRWAHPVNERMDKLVVNVNEQMSDCAAESAKKTEGKFGALRYGIGRAAAEVEASERAIGRELKNMEDKSEKDIKKQISPFVAMAHEDRAVLLAQGAKIEQQRQFLEQEQQENDLEDAKNKAKIDAIDRQVHGGLFISIRSRVREGINNVWQDWQRAEEEDKRSFQAATDKLNAQKADMEKVVNQVFDAQEELGQKFESLEKGAQELKDENSRLKELVGFIYQALVEKKELGQEIIEEEDESKKAASETSLIFVKYFVKGQQMNGLSMNGGWLQALNKNKSNDSVLSWNEHKEGDLLWGKSNEDFGGGFGNQNSLFLTNQ